MAADPRVQDVSVGLPRSFPYELSSFYIRDCYGEYYKRVMDRFGQGYNYISVTGTPGIGKSLFYDYFFARYRKEHPDKTIVTAAFNKHQDVEECVIFRPYDDTGYPQYVDGNPNLPVDEPEALHLYDGAPKVKPPRSKMVAFTSPNFRWLDSMHKNGAHSPLYMPVWGREELRKAVESMKLEISEQALGERYELFGGIPRYCLATDIEFYEDGVNRLSDGVKKIDNFAILRKCLDDPESVATPEVVHRLFYYVPDGNPRRASLTIGTDRIGLMLYDQLQKELDADRKKLMEWLEGAGKASPLAGWLFENLAHETLIKGGTFKYWRLGQAGREEEDVNALMLDRTVGDYERISSHVDLKEVFRNVYHIPQAQNFKSIDSFKLVNGLLLLFQITRSAVHPVNSSGLVDMFIKLRMEETIKGDPTMARIIFVVPKGMGATYKKQGLTATASDNWERADVNMVRGIGRSKKRKLNDMKVMNCADLIAQYNKDPAKIGFVAGAVKTFLDQVGATYLDEIPQYVLELEE